MSYITNYTTNTIYGTKDIGQFNSRNTINMSVIGPTNSKQTIQYGSPTTIYASGVIANIDGQCNNGNQVYTFGPAIPGMWVAAGSGTINTMAYSTDGINWIGLGKSIFSINGRDIAWNGTMWVAVGQGTNSIAYSYDGIHWTGLGNTIFQEGLSVTWNGTMWLVGCVSATVVNGVWVANTTNPCFVWSNDGINWNKTIDNSLFTLWTMKTMWNGSMWVAAGQNVSSGNTIAYSYDGKTWIQSTTGGTILGGSVAVVWNGTMWIVGGTMNSEFSMATSLDGKNWTGVPTTNSIIGNVYGIAWNGKMFVAVGETTNTIAYSYDGFNWTGVQNSLTIFIRSDKVYWNGTMWIAIGITGPGGSENSGNAIVYSYDGINWTGAPTSTGIFSSYGFGIAYNNKRANTITFPRKLMVAVGSGTSTIAYSDNGKTWTGVESPFTIGYGVAWNGTMWVAVGSGTNSIAYSYNGIDWIPKLSPDIWYPLKSSNVIDNTNLGYYNKTTYNTSGASLSVAGIISTSDKKVGDSCLILDNPINGIDAKKYVSLAPFTPTDTGLSYACWFRSNISPRTKILEIGYYTAYNIALGINRSGVLEATYDENHYDNGITPTKKYVLKSTNIYNNNAWVHVAVTISRDPCVWIMYINGVNINATSTYTTVYPSTIQYSTNYLGKSNWGDPYFNGAIDDVRIYNSVLTTDKITSIYNYKTPIIAPPAITYPFTTGRGVAWNGIMWIAVGQGTNSIAWSTDGKSGWTGVTWTGTSFTAGNGVTWNGYMWVAVGEGTNKLAWSIDGKTWTPGNNSPFTLGNGVAWNGSMWVAVGAGTNKLAWSTDGVNWTGIVSSIFTAGNGVAWNGSMWVAVGQGTNTIAWSTNGRDWTGIVSSIFTSGKGVTWNGSMWVAVGEGTTYPIAWSSDGKTWIGVSSTSILTPINGIACNNNLCDISINQPIYTPSSTSFAGSISYPGNISLSNYNTQPTQTLEIVSDSYYNTGYTNMSVSISNIF
jgi:hypothetical protein